MNPLTSSKRILSPLAVALAAVALATSACSEPVMTEQEYEDSDAVVNSLKGTVSEVRFRENKAEDGHFSFVVKNGNKRYLIDATAYMNTPMKPEDDGKSCLIFEKDNVAEGDTVRFFLPPAVHMNFPEGEVYNAVFETCHSENATEEYFIETASPPEPSPAS